MAASAWVLYNLAKQKLGDGTHVLDTDVFRLGLYTSASNAATVTLSTRGSVTGEVVNANGYLTGGQTLGSVTWGAGASAGVRQFDSAAEVFTASGGTILNAKHAVIYNNSKGASAGLRPLLCTSQLSTAEFDLTDTNTLTITPDVTNGIFEMT